MPVVVTGASGLVGRALIPMLAPRGEVRAVVRDRRRADRLRDAGAKVAVTSLGHPDTLVSVMDGAHTLCHLVGGLDVQDGAYERINLDPLRATVAAAKEAGVRRVLFLSYVGASADAPNEYLRAKGRAEDLVRASGLEHVVIRSTHVYGAGSAWLRAMEDNARRPVAALVIGSGRQRVAPVYVEDVARALVAADDRGSEVRATLAVAGPDAPSADDLVDLLAGRQRRKIHLGPAAIRRVARITGRSPSLAMLEVLAADSVRDAPDAATELGIELTPLEVGLAWSRVSDARP